MQPELVLQSVVVLVACSLACSLVSGYDGWGRGHTGAPLSEDYPEGYVNDHWTGPGDHPKDQPYGMIVTHGRAVDQVDWDKVNMREQTGGHLQGTGGIGDESSAKSCGQHHYLGSIVDTCDESLRECYQQCGGPNYACFIQCHSQARSSVPEEEAVVMPVEEPESEVTPVTDGWQNVHTAKDWAVHDSAGQMYYGLDENDDSVIDRTELIIAIQTQPQVKVALGAENWGEFEELEGNRFKREFDALFQALDFDNDNVLSRNEWPDYGVPNRPTKLGSAKTVLTF